VKLVPHAAWLGGRDKDANHAYGRRRREERLHVINATSAYDKTRAYLPE
jgi:hypothetical protein